MIEYKSEIKRLSELAYVGEHQHEDYTYKYRCKELQVKLRELETELSKTWSEVQRYKTMSDNYCSLLMDTTAELNKFKEGFVVNNLKVWYVTHLHAGKKYSSVVLSKSRYLASTYVEGQVLNVEESWGKPVEEGSILSSSGWAIGFFDNHSKKDYEVSGEWRQYLIRRYFDDGIED